MTRARDAIVVGLGAMGSATAYHLARRGARVLGLDAYAPPHTYGSHHGESRIIRTAYYEHPSYVPLVERSFAAWEELERRAARRLMLRTGGLMIGRETGTLVAGVLASIRAHGLAHARLSGSELMARYPFRVDPEMVAVWEADAGILFPEACIRAFLDGAAAGQAELRYAEPALEWSADADGVTVRTARGTYTAGALVITAGTGMRGLVAELRPRLTVERQIVAHFEPLAARERLAPERFPIFCLEEADGGFYYGFPDLGTGCKIGRHHRGATGEPAELAREVSQADVEDLRGFLGRHLPSVDGAVSSSAVCLYTNTPDGHFIIDRHPHHDNVILASVCSGHGFKFAPVVGESLADLARGTAPSLDLGLFRLDRGS